MYVIEKKKLDYLLTDSRLSPDEQMFIRLSGVNEEVCKIVSAYLLLEKSDDCSKMNDVVKMVARIINGILIKKNVNVKNIPNNVLSNEMSSLVECWRWIY